MAEAREGSPAKRWLPLGFAALALGLLYLLYRNLSKFDYFEILERIKGYSAATLLLSVACAAASYLIMGGYDWLGQRYVGRRQNWKRTLLVAFYSYALSLNVGLSLVSSSAVRCKMYQSWGYKAAEIAKLIVFASVSFWLGLVTLAGVALVAADVSFDGSYPIPGYLARPLGWLMLACGIAYLFACRFARGSLTLLGRELSLPGWGSGLGQIGVTAADMLAAGAALYFLIPDEDLGFFAFVSIFCIAFFGGMLSNAPGGIGVFETVFLLFLPTTADANELMAALVVYRAIYFLFPLVVACLLFSALEGQALLGKFEPGMAKARVWLTAIAPRMLSALIFVGGLVLLFAGSLPPSQLGLGWIRDFMPLVLLELSHFAASLFGLALLFLAYGIKRKIDSAYYLALAALALAVPLSVFRGDGIGMVLMLSIFALILLPCRRYFYRRSSLLKMEMSVGSLLVLLLALACSVYLGMFVRHETQYEHLSWWEFEFAGDHPRFLRSYVGLAILGLLYALYRLMNTVKPDVGLQFEQCKDEVMAVMGKSPVAASNLALMGDKRFLFSDCREAFIMFRVSGKTWISMGDPVGDPAKFELLIGRFRELAAEHGGQPLFYQASRQRLHNYVDAGLQPVKVGEIARVRVSEFSIQGSRRQSMRSRLKRVARKGCSFHVLSEKESLTEMATLRRVSDQWLRTKQAREKGFSLGYFDEEYLANFKFAVVKLEGDIVAFTNIWDTKSRAELSIDLMRYSAAAPSGVMEFLFVELIKWAQENRYEYFDLRVAPLSGIAVGNSSPYSHKLLDLAFNYGERFYGFKGLRRYKDRFDPEWEPVYIASPSNWRLPFAAADVSRVVSAVPKARHEAGPAAFSNS